MASQTILQASPVPVGVPAFLRDVSAPAPAAVSLLYGDALAFKISHVVISKIVQGNNAVAIVDGCNRFDLHFLSRSARRQRLDADQFLDRIFVSRCFTCYQVEAAIAGKLPACLERTGARAAFIFGMLDTMYDEQAKLREVTQIVHRVVATLHALRDAGISVLLVSQEWNVLPKERNGLLGIVKASADRVYHLSQSPEGQPRLSLETHVHGHHPRIGAPEYGTNRTDIHKRH